MLFRFKEPLSYRKFVREFIEEGKKLKFDTLNSLRLLICRHYIIHSEIFWGGNGSFNFTFEHLGF